MHFPIYARSADGAVYYRIDSDSGFNEWRRLGARYLHTEMTVKDYMDQLYISDLIASIDSGRLIRMSEEEFDRLTLHS